MNIRSTAVSFLFVLLILTSCKDTENQEVKFVEPEGFLHAHWGIRVEDRETGEVLVDYFGEKQFIPASVNKLFTTFYALQTLGEDYRFETSLHAFAPIDEDGVLRGDLMIEGGFDPVFDRHEVEELVMQLIEQGLNTVEGAVMVDRTNDQIPPLMKHAEWEDLTWGYCAELTPLTYRKNQVMLRVSPAKEPGSPALIEIEQDVPYVSFLSGVGTGSAEEQLQIDCERGITDNTVEVRGVIPIGHPEVGLKIAVYEASEYARRAFEQALLERRVKIKNRPFRHRRDRVELARVFSPPLIEIINTINKESDNLSAELVYLQIPEGQRPHLVYGSGLSRHNLATPKEVCALLRQGNAQWIYTFPVAGVDGSLQNRFKGSLAESNLQAKTGSMSGVIGLAGVATTQSGREVCFCFFLNQFDQSLEEAYPVFDQVVTNILLTQ